MPRIVQILKREKEVFCVKRAKTERLKRSAIVSMQKLLNNEASKNRAIMTKISNCVPVNYDCMQSIVLLELSLLVPPKSQPL